MLSIGGDPEFFIKDPNGDFVGAFEFFPGTKENPYELINGSVQVDGFAVEVNLKPAITILEFDRNVTTLIEECKQFLPEGYEFHFGPVAEFDKDYFESAPSIHKIIGCSPSFDYSKNEVVSPPLVAQSNIRYAGGHIHVGTGHEWDVEDPIDQHVLASIARSSDWRLINHFDGGSSWSRPIEVTDRLNAYECGSSIRFKPYGLEFRRPVNYWVNPVNRHKRHEIFSRIQTVFDDMGVIAA